MDKGKISLVLTNYNRYDAIIRLINNVTLFDEVVINDDCSEISIFNRLKDFCDTKSHVKLYRNESNVGAFHNKYIAMTKASNDWCVLFDSDNLLKDSYVQTLLDMDKWDDDTIYQPSQFGPFNFIGYEGTTFSKPSDLSLDLGALFNGGNYFVNKNKYISVVKGWEDIIKYVEVNALLYLWLLDGGKFHVTPNLNYLHITSPDSFYMSHEQYHIKMKAYLLDCVNNGKKLNKEEIIKLNSI
jgi:glycosyltransferase involved in cell wall biosynthesis|tara:strand:- start:220 stop:942 length:723 start_codon:yes stop_codon:yes gene_type:complete